MIENSPYLVVGLIVLAFLLGYGVLPFDSSALLLTVVIVSNTANLFALMFVLGYGLIAYPQMLWASASVDTSLLRAQQNAAAQFRSFNDVTAEVSQVPLCPCLKMLRLPHRTDQMHRILPNSLFPNSL